MIYYAMFLSKISLSKCAFVVLFCSCTYLGFQYGAVKFSQGGAGHDGAVVSLKIAISCVKEWLHPVLLPIFRKTMNKNMF